MDNTKGTTKLEKKIRDENETKLKQKKQPTTLSPSSHSNPTCFLDEILVEDERESALEEEFGHQRLEMHYAAAIKLVSVGEEHATDGQRASVHF
jgi:hypothetical protein